MRLVWSMVLAGFAGCATHQLRSPLRQHLGDGWFDLARDTLGVLANFWFFKLLWRNLHNQDAEQRADTAYLLSFLSFAAGVCLAFFLDQLHWPKKNLRLR